ncbi:hypothetical protein [Rhodothermus profundi]|uniref:Uncharacterized protein n=1 Tax=Rhodothermus profundi TaxID=633813 RepID=A0A1M6T0I1_9BACT|nr:hypothetical protein [Rhodothermus profundi]SHK50502.1 hypothetical protein SAMN04488087_1310 [Rhodothermus profundi]
MRKLFNSKISMATLVMLILTLVPAAPVLADTCDAALAYCKEECREMYPGDNDLDSVQRSGCYSGCFIAWSACKLGIFFE